MRNLLTLAIAAISLTVASCAPAPETARTTPEPAATSKPAATENAEPAIRQLVTERDQAIQSGDVAAIESIYADDYISTSASGLLRTKAQVIEDFKTGALKIESISSDDVNVRLHGDTAIVTGRMTSKGKDRDREVSGKNRFTQVYMRGNGRWRLVAFHYSRIAE